MRTKLLFLLCLLVPTLAQAGVPRTQSPTTDTALANYLKSLENHLNTLEVLGVNPDGTVLGTKGELKGALYDSANHLCMNTSTGPQKGTDWLCLAAGGTGTPGGSDTMVQFNDAGSFGGDAGFLYGKTVDHASLGPDAAIDKTFSPDNFNNYFGGSFASLFVLPDVRGDWGTTNLNGIEVEFKSEPSGTEGFNNVILNGVTSRFVADGSAGSTAATRTIVDSMLANHFNALTQVRGTGSVDEIDSLQGIALNSEVLINLSGSGTNIIDIDSWKTILDEITLTAETIDLQTYAHKQLVDVNATSSPNEIFNQGFETKTDVSATGSTDDIHHEAFASIVTVVVADPTESVSRHVDLDADYTSSASTGDNNVIDAGLIYFYDINGDSADTASSVAFYTHQNSDIDQLDDGPGAVGGLSTSDDANSYTLEAHSLYGWRARQLIGDTNDSGTFNVMRGVHLDQYWVGDANGTTVDGFRIEGLSKAGTGTVTTATDINLVAPVRTAGTLTNAYTIQLTVPTTGGTENAGIRFADGLSNLIEFEGNTADGNETRFSLTEPDADNTITIPVATGTMAVSTGISATHAVCWKADGETLGYCSDVVGVTGTCTCN